MDYYHYPDDGTEPEIHPVTILQLLLIAGISFFAILTWLSESARIGPDIGTMVVFDPQKGPRDWQAPGILAFHAPAGGLQPDQPVRGCILMPSVMSAGGGSFVIEAKEMSSQPSFRIHWSGPHTDLGARDCGVSADLIVQLYQLRTLAGAAGGYGVRHWRGWF